MSCRVMGMNFSVERLKQSEILSMRLRNMWSRDLFRISKIDCNLILSMSPMNGHSQPRTRKKAPISSVSLPKESMWTSLASKNEVLRSSGHVYRRKKYAPTHTFFCHFQYHRLGTRDILDLIDSLASYLHTRTRNNSS